jgi:predicted PurR-regulated permease PerM
MKARVDEFAMNFEWIGGDEHEKVIKHLATTLFLAPQLAQQSGTLTEALSSSLTGAERYLLVAFEFLDEQRLLLGAPEQAVSKIAEDLSKGAGVLAEDIAGSDFNLVSGVFSIALSLFGVIFVAVYLLADSRRIGRCRYCRKISLVVANQRKQANSTLQRR